MSAEKFLDELEQQALLEPKTIEELRRQAASKRKVTSQSIAKLLVDKGRLTAFQAKNILAKVQDEVDLTTEGDDGPDEEEVVELNPAEPAASAPAKPPSGLTPLPAGGGAAPAAKKGTGGLTPLTSENAVATETPGLTPLTDTAPASGGLTPITQDAASGGLTPLTQDAATGGLTPLTGTGDPLTDAAAAEGGGWMDQATEPPPEKQTGVFQSKKARANQWDSPWLLIGGCILLLCLIIVGVLAYVLTRASEDEIFEAAEKSYNQESYGEAAERYQEYLEKFPDGENIHQARVRLVLAHMRLPIVSRDWEQALEVAKEELPTIEESLAEYNEGRSELATLLPDIAEGFSTKANELITQVNPDTDRASELVEFTEEAMKLVNNPVYLPTSERTKPAVETRVKNVTTTLGQVRFEIEAEEDLVAAIEQIHELVDKSDT